MSLQQPVPACLQPDQAIVTLRQLAPPAAPTVSIFCCASAHLQREHLPLELVGGLEAEVVAVDLLVHSDAGNGVLGAQVVGKAALHPICAASRTAVGRDRSGEEGTAGESIGCLAG